MSFCVLIHCTMAREGQRCLGVSIFSATVNSQRLEAVMKWKLITRFEALVQECLLKFEAKRCKNKVKWTNR